MDRMSLLILGLASVIVAPVRAATTDEWQPVIAEAAQRFDISPSWIRAVMLAESGGEPSAVSPKGAIGLMQIMPATWAEWRSRLGLGDDPFDPRDNILAGAAFLRQMRDRFGYPGLFAAYNAGPARYDDPSQGRDAAAGRDGALYLHPGAGAADESMPPVVLSGTRLFFQLRTVEDSSPDGRKQASSGSLFVPLTTVPDPPPVPPHRGPEVRGLVSDWSVYQPERSGRQGCVVPPKCCAFWLPPRPRCAAPSASLTAAPPAVARACPR